MNSSIKLHFFHRNVSLNLYLHSQNLYIQCSGVILDQNYIWLSDAALNDLFFPKIYFIQSSVKLV